MNFDSLEFVAFGVAAIFVLRLATHGLARSIAVTILNFIFLISFAPSARGLLPMALLIVAGYGAVVASKRARQAGMAVLIALVVILFAWLRKYPIAGLLPRIGFSYLTVGMSYIMFRILHLVVDTHQDAIEAPGPWEYLNYTLFFLSFVSGPIQRFEDFREQMAAPRLTQRMGELSAAFDRILLGYILLSLVSPRTLGLFENCEHRFAQALAAGSGGLDAVMAAAAVASAYAVHLYIGFSGYMHLVIGIGIACGIRLPENFDSPFLSSNMLEFWSRWHITLSEWFKFYVFNPLLKYLAEHWGTPSSTPYLGAAAFFVTFFAMGIWHGNAPIFVIYGALLGFGVTANKFTQIELTRRLGKKVYKQLAARTWYRNICRALCLAWFACSISCLWLNPSEANNLATLKESKVVVGAFLVLVCLIFIIGVSVEVFGTFVNGAISLLRRRVASDAWPDWALPAWSAVKVFVLLEAVIYSGGTAPELAYKWF